MCSCMYVHSFNLQLTVAITRFSSFNSNIFMDTQNANIKKA